MGNRALEVIILETMYDRIARRCAELGYTPGGFFDKIGMRRAYISEIKMGKVKSMSTDKISAIAAGLRVSCDYLINGTEFTEKLSEDEQQLLNAWRHATVAEKENVAFILRNYNVSVPQEDPARKAV